MGKLLAIHTRQFMSYLVDSSSKLRQDTTLLCHWIDNDFKSREEVIDVIFHWHFLHLRAFEVPKNWISIENVQNGFEGAIIAQIISSIGEQIFISLFHLTGSFQKVLKDNHV